MSDEAKKLTAEELKVWDLYFAAAVSGLLSKGPEFQVMYGVVTEAMDIADRMVTARRERGQQ
jgi:hypothetical protein